jgi:PilZ domain-containing protein
MLEEWRPDLQSSSGGSADPRLDERSNVFLSATMHGASGTFPVRIRNISPMGAMLDGARLPEEGSRVNLERGLLAAEAEVAWQSGDFRGVRFDEPIDIEAWLRRPGHSGQERVDGVVRALRDGAPLPVSAAVESAPSVEQLSQELLHICERMAASPDLTVQFGEDVMKVESIALSLQQLGDES